MKSVIKSWLLHRHWNIFRVFQLLHYEAKCAFIHLKGKLSRQQRARILQYRAANGLKINVAAGGVRKPGWINIDILPSVDIRMDIRRPLPLEDGSVSLLFFEHFADHLGFPDEIMRLLSEFHRILEPNGRARFVIFDGRKFMQACLTSDAAYFAGCYDPSSETVMMAANSLMLQTVGRLYLYDYETFERLLRNTGFSHIIPSAYRCSDIPELVLDVVEPHREFTSMYIEVMK